MTERDVQQALYWRGVRRGVKWMAPNIYLYGWESDFLSISHAGIVTEYEIKVSRSDFFEDLKKTRNGLHDGRGPAYFMYACPFDLIRPDELPAHAGLLYIKSVWAHRIVKPPKKLHSGRITGATSLKLMISVYHRYWKLWNKR